MGNGNLLPFSCDWVLRGKCTPPSLSGDQQQQTPSAVAQGEISTVRLICEAFELTRVPGAREEVGLQRKEGRRLNLHQNVWLPVLGKGRGSGGGWKGRKPGKTALPNREMGKRPRFYTRSRAFHVLLEQSPIRALSSKLVTNLKGSFPKNRVRRHQTSRF